MTKAMYIILCSFFLHVVFANAQHTHPPYPSHLDDEISAQRLLNQIRDLSSPAFQGRELGTHSNRQAVDWLMFNFENIGLKTLPGHDDLAHSFPIHRLSPGDQTSAAVGGQELELFRDYTITHYSGKDSVRAEVLEVEWSDRDSFDPDSLKNRILVIHLTESDALQTNVVYGIHPAAEWAEAHEAAGVILAPKNFDTYLRNSYRFETDITIPEDAEKHIGNTERPYVAQKQLDLPVIVWNPHEREISNEPHTEAMINVDITSDEADRADNVVGYLGEFIPDRPYIVIAAHFDGQGLQEPTGIPYFGSNRNATGISVLLEIARALEHVEDQLEYPVIFAAWNAHERFYGGVGHFFEEQWTDNENVMSYITLSDLSGLEDTTHVDFYGVTPDSPVYPHLDELTSRRELPSQFQPLSNSPAVFTFPDYISTEIVGIHGGEYSYTGRIHDSPDKIHLQQVYQISLLSLELTWNLATLYDPI